MDENAAIGTTVGITAVASDADATTNAITYTLDDTAGGRFAIDGVTGVVTVAAARDSRSGRPHNITVRATSADGSFSTQMFTINVNDVDEFDVSAVTDTDAAANAVSRECGQRHSGGHHRLGQRRGCHDQRVTYTLDDTAGGRFAINAATGVVTVAGRPRSIAKRRAAQHHGARHLGRWLLHDTDLHHHDRRRE